MIFDKINLKFILNYQIDIFILINYKRGWVIKEIVGIIWQMKIKT